MTTYTLDSAKTWIADHDLSLGEALAASDVPDFMKSLPFMRPVWDAGCWLGEILRELGASDAENSRICFAHGQRSLGGDTLAIAVNYANEFAGTATTSDRPGVKLANTIHVEMFG